MLHVFHRKTDYGGTGAAALAQGLHHDHLKLLIFYICNMTGHFLGCTLYDLKGTLAMKETHLRNIATRARGGALQCQHPFYEHKHINTCLPWLSLL